MRFILRRNIPRPQGRTSILRSFAAGFGRALLAFCILAGLAGSAQQQVQPSPNQAAPPTGPGRAWSSSQLQIADSHGPQNFDALNAERKKQIADDSAKLLQLATELKAEVDKTTKDTLSLAVIRKANEIERLAHGVKEKMRIAAPSN